MDKLKLDRKSLKQFGITMAIAFLIITLIIFIRHKYSVIPASVISVTFLILAFTLPALLKPIYILWMRLAFVLGWINTRLILFIIFYLVFTPTGIVMKLFGVDLLDKKIDKNRESYWRGKEKGDSSLLTYERRF